MSNTRKPKSVGDKVAKMQADYEARLARQVEIIDRLKNDYLDMKREITGAGLIMSVLLKRIGEPVVISRAELVNADRDEVTIVEREDGGMLVRLENK